MITKLDFTASIVLYNENLNELIKTVDCFLNTSLKKKLFLIDNTSNQKFKNIFNYPEVEYIAVGKNIGFGAGHNMVTDKIKDISPYHLILNPDVFFKSTVIPNLIGVLEMKNELAMIAPKVLFPDKTHQYSCRRYPSRQELLARRFLFFKSIFKKVIYKGTYRDRDLNQPFFC